MVNTLGCDPGECGFEPRRSPHGALVYLGKLHFCTVGSRVRVPEAPPIFKMKKILTLLALTIVLITLTACKSYYVESKHECKHLLNSISKIEIQENYIMYKGPASGAHLPHIVKCYFPK